MLKYLLFLLIFQLDSEKTGISAGTNLDPFVQHSISAKGKVTFVKFCFQHLQRGMIVFSRHCGFSLCVLTEEEDWTIDASLWKLAKHLVTESDLRDVALNGLQIPGNTVEQHIKNNQKDITSAAYSCFREWLSTQPTFATARGNMNRALDKTNKPLLKQSFNKTVH